jgi:hypothetical protein
MKEDECTGNAVYSCMKKEEWDMLKLFQEWGEGGDREEGWRSEFSYDIL